MVVAEFGVNAVREKRVSNREATKDEKNNGE